MSSILFSVRTCVIVLGNSDSCLWTSGGPNTTYLKLPDLTSHKCSLPSVLLSFYFHMVLFWCWGQVGIPFYLNIFLKLLVHDLVIVGRAEHSVRIVIFCPLLFLILSADHAFLFYFTILILCAYFNVDLVCNDVNWL